MGAEYTMPAVNGYELPMDDPEEKRRRLANMALSGGGAMPAAAPSAPPVKTPSVDVARPMGDNATMPPAMAAAPGEMRANALEPGTTPPGFFAGAGEHPHAESGPGMPAAFYAGNSEHPHKPTVQPDAMPAVGPATQGYQDLQAQGRPELHGWKKALDVASQFSPIGRRIEKNISGSPGHYDDELSRAAQASTREQGIEKHQDAAQTGAVDRRNTESQIRKRDAETDEIQNPPAPEVKPAPDPKTEFELWRKNNPNGTAQDWANFQAGNRPAPADANKLAAEIEAQVGPKPTTAVWQGKNYGTPEKAQAAWGAEAEKIKAREARVGPDARGNSYSQSRLFNVIRNGQLKAIHPDEVQEGDVLAGTSAGEHAMSKQAQFGEIHSGIEKARDAINALDRPFDAAQIGKLTLAMRHTTDPGIFRNELETILGSQELTPAQQDLVIWLGHLNERALSIRNIAGMGQGSDSMRAAIQAVLPNLKSGSKEMMLKQLAAFENQVQKLEVGVPKMPGQGGAGGGGFTRPKPNVVVEK